jgi:uncharacterized membrane protein
MNLHDAMLTSILFLGILVAYFATRSGLVLRERVTQRDVLTVKAAVLLILLGYVVLAITATLSILRYIFKTPQAYISGACSRYSFALLAWLVVIPVVFVCLPFRPSTSALVYDDEESVIKKASVLVWLKSYCVLTCMGWIVVWGARAQP